MSEAAEAPTAPAAVGRRRRLRPALALFGPAFVASVAYVDPGNFATNFSAGAGYEYQLLWVVVLANLMAMLVQYLSAKVGIATGRSLPELCRNRFGRRTNIVLWIQAEIVAMATDLAEFVGAAVGLNLIFGMPLFPAGVVTAVVAFGILALDRRSYRRFEIAVIALLGLVAAGFFYVLIAVGNQDYAGLGRGLVPDLSGPDALSLAVGIVGATVMPHVVYLHSALHHSRMRSASTGQRRRMLFVNRWDTIAGLGVAGLVNLTMLCIAAALLYRPGSPATADLDSIHAQLATLVGGGAALAFGIALLASGFSSSSVGTYAGQIVMAGFINRRIPIVVRRALTVLPSLVVLALAVNPSRTLVYSQIVLSFGIPFALVPLVIVTRDRRIMKDMVNRRSTTGLLVGIAVLISTLNAYLLFDATRSLL